MGTRARSGMAALSGLAFLVLSAACGGDAGTGGGPTTATTGPGGPAPQSGSTSATGSSSDACGPEPTVLLTGTFTSYLNQLPVIDGVVTSDSCPGQSYITNNDGFVSARVARDIPFYPKIVAQSYVTVRLGEQILVGDYDTSAELYPETLLPLVPTWSLETPTILAVVQARSSAPAACQDLEGYTFAVPDHPEAEVLYYVGAAVPQADPKATSTGPFGLATIAGLAATAPGTFVRLTVEKDGCEPSFVSYPQTGNYVLENGVMTAALAFVPATPVP